MDPIEDSLSAALHMYYGHLPAELRKAAMVPEPVPAPVRVNGTVVDHHDGDTFFVDLDLDIDDLMAKRQSIRIIGGNARELSQPGGKEARDSLKARHGMTVGSQVVLTAIATDRWGGRLDAVVSYRAADGSSHDLAGDLILEQWLAPWDGHGTKPLPPWPRTVA